MAAVYTCITHGQIQDPCHPYAKSSTDIKYCLKLLISSYLLQITQKERWHSSSLTTAFQMCAQHNYSATLTHFSISPKCKNYGQTVLYTKYVFQSCLHPPPLFFLAKRFCELPQRYAQTHMWIFTQCLLLFDFSQPLNAVTNLATPHIRLHKNLSSIPQFPVCRHINVVKLTDTVFANSLCKCATICYQASTCHCFIRQLSTTSIQQMSVMNSFYKYVRVV